MRKGTVVRAIVAAVFFSITAVTAQMSTDSRTQDCWQECETAYNQCMADCQGWAYFFCSGSCTDRYTYCIGVCNGGGDCDGPLIQNPV